MRLSMRQQNVEHIWALGDPAATTAWIEAHTMTSKSKPEMVAAGNKWPANDGANVIPFQKPRRAAGVIPI